MQFTSMQIPIYLRLPIYRYVVAGPDLGKLYIVLSDDVERQLRLEVVKRLGGKKGDLSGAIEEAVNDWLSKKPGDRTQEHPVLVH